MNKYASYIGKILHQNINITEYDNQNTLPLYLRNGNNLSLLTIYDTQCLLVQPKEQTNLTNLRKQIIQLKKLTGLDCVLCLDNTGTYTKDKMLSEGIPFVNLNKQIYMPFLGVALSSNDDRVVSPIEQISFSTQKLLLTSIYEKWNHTTLTEAALKLNVSKMTMTRCFDELYSTNLNLIERIGKNRCFVWDGGQRSLWDSVRIFLRNPVVRQYRLGQTIDIGNARLNGMSAVCHYSMLSDNFYTTYAVSKDDEKKLELGKQPRLIDVETPVIVIQVLGYNLYYDDNIAIDPLTAILSLTDDEINDPRVEAAIEEILEDLLND